MESDFHDLKETYRKCDDEKLMRLATQDASGLRPEAVQALKEVIEERGLSEGIMRGVEVQRKPIDDATLLAYAQLLRDLPCPHCGTTETKLNGTVTGTVVSAIFFTNYDKRLRIACSKCLDEANDSGTRKSIALGWWGFPWGPIKTIQCLSFNSRMKGQNHLDEPNETLIGFALSNIGKIEAYRNNQSRLRDLIRYTD